jgi:hypothetical protein
VSTTIARVLLGVAAALCVALTQAAETKAPPAKAAPKKFVVPKTELGQPEIRGVWNYSSDTPFERPAEFKDREFLNQEEIAARRKAARAQMTALDGASIAGVGGYNIFWMDSFALGDSPRTSLIIDPPNGRLPALQPGIKVEAGGLGPDTGGQRPVRFRVGGVRKDGPEDRGLSERCLMGYSSGPPFMPSIYNNIVQIFQTRTHVVIMTEMIHDARIVPLDARPALDPELRQWSGDSRGRWEGDTLVVETRNFTDKTQSFNGMGAAGPTLRLTERFTRVGSDRIDYQFTIEDPATFTRPFTVLVPMARSDGDLYEYACHEGNYGMFNILSGARAEEGTPVIGAQ